MARKRANKGTDRLQALAAVAPQMKTWAPAHEVLTNVLSVPTIFPQFNVATGVNGWPLQRPCLVHGPSNHGKTIFIHGVGLSFLQAGHFYNYVDAEMTTPETWLALLMDQWSRSPGFRALRPKSYETTVDAVREACAVLANAREKNQLPEDTTMLFAIDSLRKLNPERLMEKIADKGATGKKESSVDGAGGRAAQYKAALNAQWLDELVPLLYHAKASLVFVGRESENTEKRGPFDRTWKLTGGKAVYYDSSLVIRITRAGWTKKGEKVIGERHLAEIHKTKVAGKDDKIVKSHFHTSNGVYTQAGYDRVRDILQMALDCGVISKKGSTFHLSDTGEVVPGNGIDAACKAMHAEENREMLADIELQVNSNFVPVEEDAPEEDAI